MSAAPKREPRDRDLADIINSVGEGEPEPKATESEHKVWLLSDGEANEGTTPLGVFASVSAAREAAAEKYGVLEGAWQATEGGDVWTTYRPDGPVSYFEVRPFDIQRRFDAPTDRARKLANDTAVTVQALHPVPGSLAVLHVKTPEPMEQGEADWFSDVLSEFVDEFGLSGWLILTTDTALEAIPPDAMRQAGWAPKSVVEALAYALAVSRDDGAEPGATEEALAGVNLEEHLRRAGWVRAGELAPPPEAREPHEFRQGADGCKVCGEGVMHYLHVHDANDLDEASEGEG